MAIEKQMRIFFTFELFKEVFKKLWYVVVHSNCILNVKNLIT